MQAIISQLITEYQMNVEILETRKSRLHFQNWEDYK